MSNQDPPESEESGQAHDSSTSIGRWMIVAMWVLVIGMGTWAAHLYLEKRARGQIPVNILSPDGRKSVQLEADRLGHYVVAGEVNGHLVTFLVDTGASGVSIPSEIAEELGLKPGLSFPVNTANGTIMVRETSIDELAIGELALENVRASINSSMDGEVGLLGMTYLRHFELIQSQGMLTIREP